MSTFTKAEKDKLIETFENHFNYLEYGLGESTVLASNSKSIKSICCLETLQPWINYYNPKLNKKNKLIKIDYIDIESDEKRYGHPKNTNKKYNWPLYQSYSKNKNFDLCFIDARFRVSSFLNCYINAPIDCCLMIHDYKRSYYNDIEKAVEKHEQIDTLAFFYKKQIKNHSRIWQIIEKYTNDPR